VERENCAHSEKAEPVQGSRSACDASAVDRNAFAAVAGAGTRAELRQGHNPAEASSSVDRASGKACVCIGQAGSGGVEATCANRTPEGTGGSFSSRP
jgi:hypothetical protein